MSDLKTTIFEQTQLKQTLFEKANKALEDFIVADHQLDTHIGMNGFQGVKSIRDARYQRFCGIWDVVEAAGLADEYEAWKEAQGK